MSVHLLASPLQTLSPRADTLTMLSERTIHGLEIRLRPRGAGRFFSAAFLALWLCGWAAGETFAIWMLVKGAISLLTGTPPEPGREPLEVVTAISVGLFLLVWLTLWTFGGIAALHELLRLTWSEDRLIVHGGQLRLRRSTGPFPSTREFSRESMHRFGLSRYRETLTLWTTTGSVELSSLGTRNEREEAAALLRTELGISEAVDEAELPILPDGWEETLTPEGERALVPSVKRRRTQAQVASIVTLMLLGLAFVIARETPANAQALPVAIVVFTIAALLGWGAAWLARGRMEWAIGGGQLTLRKRFGGTLRPVFEGRALEIMVSRDSDSDEWFQLDALALPGEASLPDAARVKKRRRKILSTINDPSAPRQLGAWLARAADVPLTDRSTSAQSELDVGELRGQLENMGPLGRWLSRILGKLIAWKRQAR